MAIFKCKMCGGDLDVSEETKVCECEYCGTKQTVPAADNEKKINLFNRANRLRFANEFDKAAGIYESIIAEFPEESEAYWGLCLCKYGIEYVDDPTTAKKIPTCHRTSFEGIFNDSNFNLALEYADMEGLRIYREEAKEIDRLQKSILEIAQNEKPFDVFICYKETDDIGGRTKDSVLAQDIYDALTDKGYKVFFSRITLEDKLGQEFEPYIFAALNSAKVMIAIGTKYEYYNAVWVKNEWSRFLDLMKKDKRKTLIPCYCDIDAYDMPPEFKNLQGQDMSKIGFIQDLVRGIGKIVRKDEQVLATAEKIVINSNTNIEPLIKRMFLFLEDGEFDNADEYAEKILDMNPECSYAYIGKLMAELHVKFQDKLSKQSQAFDTNNNYIKAIRFSDDVLKETLTGYITTINERNRNNQLKKIYNTAIEKKKNANSEQSYISAAQIFDSIIDWKDAKEQSKYCYEQAEICKKEALYNLCNRIFNGNVKQSAKNYMAAWQGFLKLDDYRDSTDRAEKCRLKVVSFYNSAVSLMGTAKDENDFLSAATIFEELADYEDAEKKCNECKQSANVASQRRREEKIRQEREYAQKRALEIRRREEEENNLKTQRRLRGVCQHCGGEFKGLFTKKCVSCGRVKDY